MQRQPPKQALEIFQRPIASLDMAGRADDVAKTNLAAILEQHGIRNVRSL